MNGGAICLYSIIDSISFIDNGVVTLLEVTGASYYYYF